MARSRKGIQHYAGKCFAKFTVFLTKAFMISLDSQNNLALDVLTDILEETKKDFSQLKYHLSSEWVKAVDKCYFQCSLLYQML